VDYIEPPFELAEGEDLTMRIFIDKNMVEVFANDRQAAVAWHESTPQRLRIGLFSRGGDSTAHVKAWKMRSIYKPAE
jgi:sucrose-6-phosphate hydrolase SacC (GH32 family)